MEVLDRYEPIVGDVDAFVDACRRPLPTTVRVQTSRVPVERVRLAFEDAAIATSLVAGCPSLLEVETDRPGATLPAYLGWVHGQEAVSCLPAPLLEVDPGDRVWDACAAPGSKTGHIVDLMDDEGTVVATDDNLGRLTALRFNTERLGATSVVVDRVDARRFEPSGLGFDAFDAALVDAPCSCEGTVRKQPGVINDWDLDHVASLSAVQRGILRQAIARTRPGGRVVYATCTFAPEENEAVVDAVLDDGTCDVEPIEVPLQAKPGVTSWRDERYDDALRHARRIYPHLNDTGGFFVAALRVAG